MRLILLQPKRLGWSIKLRLWSLSQWRCSLRIVIAVTSRSELAPLPSFAATTVASNAATEKGKEGETTTNQETTDNNAGTK